MESPVIMHQIGTCSLRARLTPLFPLFLLFLLFCVHSVIPFGLIDTQEKGNEVIQQAAMNTFIYAIHVYCCFQVLSPFLQATFAPTLFKTTPPPPRTSIIFIPFQSRDCHSNSCQNYDIFQARRNNNCS